MNTEEAKARLAARLTEIYGIERGIRMTGTVVPGVINDFEKMLRRAGDGEPVQETYRMEDRRSVIRISGQRLGRVSFYESVTVEEI